MTSLHHASLQSVIDRRWESPPISAPSGHDKLVVTLTYPDAPGALLQNDINLIVRAGR